MWPVFSMMPIQKEIKWRQVGRWQCWLHVVCLFPPTGIHRGVQGYCQGQVKGSYPRHHAHQSTPCWRGFACIWPLYIFFIHVMNCLNACNIWGFHGGEDRIHGFLGHCIMWCGSWYPATHYMMQQSRKPWILFESSFLEYLNVNCELGLLI